VVRLIKYTAHGNTGQGTVANNDRHDATVFYYRPEMSMDWIHPWIGLDWIGLGPMTVMYKILTAYVFQRNRPRLFYAA